MSFSQELNSVTSAGEVMEKYRFTCTENFDHEMLGGIFEELLWCGSGEGRVGEWMEEVVVVLVVVVGGWVSEWVSVY